MLAALDAEDEGAADEAADVAAADDDEADVGTEDEARGEEEDGLTLDISEGRRVKQRIEVERKAWEGLCVCERRLLVSRAIGDNDTETV